MLRSKTLQVFCKLVSNLKRCVFSLKPTFKEKKTFFILFFLLCLGTCSLPLQVSSWCTDEMVI